MKTMIYVAVLMAASMTAWAAETPAEEGEALQVLVQQQQALKTDLEDGGIEGLTPRQNTVVRKAQAEFFAVTEGKAKLDDLSIDEKIRLENALERINAEVVNTRAASDDQTMIGTVRITTTPPCSTSHAASSPCACPFG